MTSIFTKHDEGGMWATKVHPVENAEKTPSAMEGSKDDIPLLRDDIKDFGGSVTLHGIRYVTDFDMHLIRR